MTKAKVITHYQVTGRQPFHQDLFNKGLRFHGRKRRPKAQAQYAGDGKPVEQFQLLAQAGQAGLPLLAGKIFLWLRLEGHH